LTNTPYCGINITCSDESNNPETVKLLLIAQANPNYADKDGITPLHCAAAQGNGTEKDGSEAPHAAATIARSTFRGKVTRKWWERTSLPALVATLAVRLGKSGTMR
jgi:hypothetical protein